MLRDRHDAHEMHGNNPLDTAFGTYDRFQHNVRMLSGIFVARPVCRRAEHAGEHIVHLLVRLKESRNKNSRSLRNAAESGREQNAKFAITFIVSEQDNDGR